MDGYQIYLGYADLPPETFFYSQNILKKSLILFENLFNI